LIFEASGFSPLVFDGMAPPATPRAA